MDPAYREILQKKIVSFRQDMVNVWEVADYLFSASVLSESMKEEILSHTTEGNRASALHALIPKRGQRAFEIYYKALRHTQNHDLADMLEPNIAKDSRIPRESTTPGETTGHTSFIKHPDQDGTDNTDLPDGDMVDCQVKKSDVVDSVMQKHFQNDREVLCEVIINHNGSCNPFYIMIDVQWGDLVNHNSSMRLIKCLDDLDERHESGTPPIVFGGRGSSLDTFIMNDLNRTEVRKIEKDDEDKPAYIEPSAPRKLSPEGIKTKLYRHRLKLIMDGKQLFKTSRNIDILWEHSLRFFSRNKCDIKKNMQVYFFNEPGQDEIGSTLEYFQLLLKSISNSPLVTGEPGNLILSANDGLFKSGAYKAMGKIVACVILQGEVYPRLFSEQVLEYERFGIKSINITDVNSVRDQYSRDMIRTIQETKSFMSEDILSFLEKNNISRPLTLASKESVIQDLILENSPIYQARKMLDDFWTGMEAGEMASLNREEPELMKTLMCGSYREELTAETLSSLFHIAEYGSPGSNSRYKSEAVAQNFESFLREVGDGDCLVGLGDVLQFVTGSSEIIPGRLKTDLHLDFINEERFPQTSTLALSLTLPLYLTEYSQFKNVMIEAIGKALGKFKFRI